MARITGRPLRTLQRRITASPGRCLGMRVVLLLAALTMSPPAHAESLPLPVPAESVLAPVAAACPGCVAPGFLPCGSPDVQYGGGFAPHAMQGAPPRAYLLARAPIQKEWLALVTGTSDDEVADALAARLAETRVVVLDDAWKNVRVLAPSEPARVEADPAQLACFREHPRDLGCCLGDGPADRGCLPKQDPPNARLRFDDPSTGEKLELRYPMSREVWLRRCVGGYDTLYWCQGWARAALRGPGPSEPGRDASD